MAFKHTPRVRRIVNLLALASAILGFCTFAIVFGTLMYRRYTGRVSCDEWLTQTVCPNAFRTVAQGIRGEGGKVWLRIDHDIPYRIQLCDCDKSCPIRSFISPGDSVIKEADSLSLMLIKADGGERRTVGYPCCE